MRNARYWGCLALLASGLAFADPNDFQLYKLGCPSAGTCGGMGVTPSIAQSNNAAFRVFANEFAAGMTSVNLMPPSSLGHDGMAVNFELSIVNFSTGTGSGQFYMPVTGPSSPVPAGQEFSGPLLMPSVHFRKGLPWSFEVGSRLAWVDKSRMGVGTIEAKWSLHEGFAFTPDLGIRGFGTRLFNTRDFDLTAAGLDIGIGKRFPIGGMITLTPYVGWNVVWVAASTNNIDFQPGRSAADAGSSATAQLTNTGVDDELPAGPNHHARYYGGLRFIGGVVQLGAEISLSSLGSFSYTDVGTGQTVTKSMPDVLAINATIGLDF
jgi:hypothetical protein